MKTKPTSLEIKAASGMKARGSFNWEKVGFPAPRIWVAHNTQGVRRWAVSVPHPSGDGSFYAPIVEGLEKKDACLIAAAPELLRVVAQMKDWLDSGADVIHFGTLMPSENSDSQEDTEDAVRAAIAKAGGVAL